MLRNLFRLGRRLWFEAQVGAPPLIQQTIISMLLGSKELFRLARSPFFSIYRLQAENEAGAFTATYFTTKEMRASSQFKDHLFKGATSTKLGRIPIWQIHKTIAAADGDLILVEAGKQLIARLSRHSAIIMPLRIYLLLDTGASWEEVQARFHKTVVRNELRLIQKNGFTSCLSHDWQDFEHFYEKMYVPTMANRHGESNTPITKEDLAIYYRYGFLFIIKQGDQAVAGGLCHTQQKVMTLIASGVLNADNRLRKEGALGALRAMLLQWANQAGFETCSFGECGPFLQDGIFQYKRKWGARITVRNRRIWLKIRHNTPAVQEFLKTNPVVVIDENNDLQGLIVTDDLASVNSEDRAEWEKLYATPGLNSLVIRSVTDLVDERSVRVA